MPAPQLPPRRTRIVATLGPAVSSRATLAELIEAGLNVARINFAHGTPEGNAGMVTAFRAAARDVGREVAVLGDLPGPKIRLGEFHGGGVVLERDQRFVLRTEPGDGDAESVFVDFDRLTDVLAPGDHVFLNDGYLDLEVESIGGSEVRCRVDVGGELRSHQGVNLPGADLGITAFTERDAELLRIAARLELDAVSQSFVQNAADLHAVREAARALDYAPFLVAKIERARALEHLDEILEAADGIMVARGDLGVETPIARMALVQKRVIAAANQAAVPVITATHMLESMIEHSRPTRAEATDVANAILDGTDCLMLSGETAVGAHPREAVRTLARIAEEVERSGLPSCPLSRDGCGEWPRGDEPHERLSTAAFRFIEELEPSIVVVGTRTGAAARLITRFRIQPWIVAVTDEPRTFRELTFSHGVHPVVVERIEEPFARLCRPILESLGARGTALLVLPAEVGGDSDAQHLQIVEL